MGNLLAIVIPLAFGAAMSPTILALQLLTLSRRVAPVQRAWAVGPPLVVTLLGVRATPLLERLNGFFTTHRRAIGAGICFTFAVLLAAAGLHALL